MRVPQVIRFAFPDSPPIPAPPRPNGETGVETDMNPAAGVQVRRVNTRQKLAKCTRCEHDRCRERQKKCRPRRVKPDLAGTSAESWTRPTEECREPRTNSNGHLAVRVPIIRVGAYLEVGKPVVITGAQIPQMDREQQVDVEVGGESKTASVMGCLGHRVTLNQIYFVPVRKLKPAT